MPNHFHILLRQRENNGISKFVSDFANSYTRYFNTRQDKRLGALFEGRFKSVHIEDENQLLHVHRYIHINPAVSYIVKSDDLENYRWSSLPEYMDIVKDDICEKQTILSNFSSVENYKSFIFDQIDYARHLKNVKHLLLD
jgi:putative transposase